MLANPDLQKPKPNIKILLKRPTRAGILEQLNVPGKAADNGPSTWASSWLWPSPVLALEVIWGRGKIICLCHSVSQLNKS